MKNKIFGLILILSLTLTILIGGCVYTETPNNNKNDNPKAIEYTEYKKNTISFNDNSDPSLSNFNTNLYYLNQWEKYDTEGIGFPDMGDPMIVYDDGYYYAYGTRGTTSIHCFRSEDLTKWTRIADCYTPAADSWSKTNIWAPDIQKIGDKWYLYYTASMYQPEGSHCYLGVAVADKPYGPFIQYTGVNANGETIGLDRSPFVGLEHHVLLDSTVFEDDDGSLYMYFSYDASTGSEEHKKMARDNAVQEIWGVKLKDPVTWDLDTLTPLLSPGYQKFNDEYRKIAWETWSPSFDAITGKECLEGPYMIKNNGKYYLTYVANSYVDINYAVGYAEADSPLGEYYKPNETYLENMILGVPSEPGTKTATRYLGFTTGTGHASIFKTGGGEYMFAYHAHYNRDEWDESGFNRGNWRALSVDYLYFDENGKPYANGPTYSLQNTPSDISGYKNLAKDATFKIEGKNPEYLNDNFTNRAYGSREITKEARFTAGTRSIEIKFDKEVTIKGLNIYNSYDREYSINTIKQIDFGNNKGIVNVNFNQKYLSTKYDDFIFPHSAFNIELDEELTTNRIVITIESTKDFALGEIEIMGK